MTIPPELIGTTFTFYSQSEAEVEYVAEGEFEESDLSDMEVS